MKKNVPVSEILTLNFKKSILLSFLCLVLIFSNKVFAQSQTFNNNGTFVVPAGVNSITVYVWGAGGSGGGALDGRGGGGGGGAFNTAVWAVTPGHSYTVTVGEGGTNAFGFGSGGGSSSISGVAGTVNAAGGGGANPGIFEDGTGGAAGTGFRNGGNGGVGGGGGAAGDNGNGNAGSILNGGSGGVGVFYNGGNGGNSPSGNSDGAIGVVPGGGGGGANSTNFFSPRSPGNGGKGRVIVRYTTGPVAPIINTFTSPTCVGQTITVTGLNFTYPLTVTFYNSIPIVVNQGSNTPTSFNVQVPSGAITGGFTVTTAGGTSPVTSDLVIQNLTTSLITSGAGTFCANTNISASGGSGGSIHFQNTNPNGINDLTGASANVTSSGTYYFREKTVCGWATSSYPVTVTINALPSTFTVSSTPTCSSSVLTPTGQPGDIFYLQMTGPLGTDEGRPGIQTVSAPGTYYYRAKSSGGCWGSAVSINVTFIVTASFTQQPVSVSACVGSNVSFTANATSGSALVYQWRKGNLDMSNGGNITGVNSPTLQINNITLGDGSTDYNCEVTDACGSIISNYVSLNVSTVATTPSNQATLLSFPAVGVTSVFGTFTASPTATDYLVVRSLNNTAFSPGPQNGVSYTIGSNVFGADTYIEYIGPNTTFTSSGLNPGTNYYFHVYAFNINTCSGSPYPYYLTPALVNNPAVRTATNTTCGTRAPRYWAGTGTAGTLNPSGGSANNLRDFNRNSNWSSTYPGYTVASVPDRCNNVFIRANQGVTIRLTNPSEIYDLTMELVGNASNDQLVLNTNGNNLIVNGNTVIDIATTSGNTTNSTFIGIGEAGNSATTIDFKANVTIGSTSLSTQAGTGFIGQPNSSIIVRGNLTMGPSFFLDNANNSKPRTLLLDGDGVQQLTWNNTGFYANFRDIEIGGENNPLIIMASTVGLPADNITGDLTINGSSVLNLATNQWNRSSNGGTFRMNGSSRLQLGGTSSSAINGSPTPISGSNFPSNFNTYNLQGTSTVEYTGSPTATAQTIHHSPQYVNLVLSRTTGINGVKNNNNGVLTVNSSTTVLANVDLQMTNTIQGAGNFTIASGGTVTAANQLINGAGVFTLANGGTIATSNVDGITTTGNAIGTVRKATGRVYNIGANYIYYGSAVNQQTGNGLPTTVNNLTINNANGVNMNGATGTYTITNNYNQTTGALALNSNTLSINRVIRSSGTITGSHTAGIRVRNTDPSGGGTPLVFTSAATGILRSLSLDASGRAYLDNSLDITAGLSAGQSGIVSAASNAILQTNDFLNLKSNEFGTASVGELPSGASINGRLTIEKYIKYTQNWNMLSAPLLENVSIKNSWQEGGVLPAPASLNGFGTQVTGPGGTPNGANGLDGNSPGYSVKAWNALAGNWTNVANTNDLTNEKVNRNEGYFLFARGDRRYGPGAGGGPTVLRSKGTIRNNSTAPSYTVTVPTQTTISVGNPYPSAVSLNEFATANFSGLEDNFWVWDPTLSGSQNVGGYQTLIRIAGVYYMTPANTPLYPSSTSLQNLQSGQAIFVRSFATNPTISFSESMKENSSMVSSRGSNQIETQNISTLSTMIYTGTGSLRDGNMVVFNETYTDAVDRQDALKLANTGVNLGLYRDTKNIAVETRSSLKANDTLYYRMTNIPTGNFKLGFSVENIQVNGLQAELVDKFLNTRTAVSLTDSTFVPFSTTAAAASKAADRFMLVFRQTAVVLPVNFVSVAARRQADRNIAINWQVANEVNIVRYEVERSANGVNFSGILTTDATGSNSYTQTDISPLQADNFYRIKAIGIGNDISYSPIVKVAPVAGKASIAVYPNPVVGKKINLVFTAQPKGDYTLELTNMKGQVVYRGTVAVTSENFSRQIELSAANAGGNYQLNITAADGSRQTIQVLLQ